MDQDTSQVWASAVLGARQPLTANYQENPFRGLVSRLIPSDRHFVVFLPLVLDGGGGRVVIG